MHNLRVEIGKSEADEHGRPAALIEGHGDGQCSNIQRCVCDAVGC